VLCYYVSLLSEFRVVMSVAISAYKRCSVRFYLELFVEGFYSYLRYLCLFTYSGVQRIVYCVFVLFFLHLVYPMLSVSLGFSSSCIPYVVSFSVFFFILYTLCCQFLCVFLHLVYLMLPVSLGCPFLIAPSVFSNVYLGSLLPNNALYLAFQTF
jgi:hypothetical protein